MTADAANKPIVLVIDDTPANLTLINGLLKGACKVKAANNGERGLVIAQTDPQPELILLDVMMPDLDGWEVCRRLKTDPKTRAIPVVFLTASVDAEAERRGRELGAADYLAKPIDPPVLLACVGAHVALR